MWLANFPKMKFVARDGTVSPNPDDNEPAWPVNVSDCDARKAFITHRISDTPGVALWDTGHLGKMNAESRANPFSRSPSRPINRSAMLMAALKSSPKP